MPEDGQPAVGVIRALATAIVTVVGVFRVAKGELLADRPRAVYRAPYDVLVGEHLLGELPDEDVQALARASRTGSSSGPRRSGTSASSSAAPKRPAMVTAP